MDDAKKSATNVTTSANDFCFMFGHLVDLL
jgi:hypothetical protein